MDLIHSIRRPIFRPANGHVSENCEPLRKHFKKFRVSSSIRLPELLDEMARHSTCQNVCANYIKADFREIPFDTGVVSDSDGTWEIFHDVWPHFSFI
jgi:hypothetical protein